MGENDIIYYVDSSQHYISGFTENIDKLLEYCFTNNEPMIAGSHGYDSLNWDDGPFNNYDWHYIWNDVNYQNIITTPHICASWFVMRKLIFTTKFIDEWIYYAINKDTPDNTPMITHHCTGDQFIFNILSYKYNLKSFRHSDIAHNANKDRNVALKYINSCSNQEEINKLFRNLMS